MYHHSGHDYNALFNTCHFHFSFSRDYPGSGTALAAPSDAQSQQLLPSHPTPQQQPAPSKSSSSNPGGPPPLFQLGGGSSSAQLKQSIQSTKNKLKNTKKSKASSSSSKRAQSIDWTSNQYDQQQQQQQQQPQQPQHTEDYYSVPRKCHRAVSQNYLDQQPASDWPADASAFSSVPVPPSSPPPSPPYANEAMWRGDSAAAAAVNGDEIQRADSMQDISRYYS